MRYTPRPYQAIATEHILYNPIVEWVGGAGLFLEMGLGKTVSTLTAVAELKRQGDIRKTLVIGPKLVASHTWKEEIKKWDHLRHLRISIVIGTERQRRAALMADADIYCINRENVPWVVKELQRRWPFDMVIVDESSSFKNPESKRFKALRMVRPKLKRIVLLTGTPSPKNLLDLWSQAYLIDRGERLEKTLGAFRSRYFAPGARKGHIVYEYELQKGEEFEGEDFNKMLIYDKLKDVVISMKARDWLDLPARTDLTVDVHFDAATRQKYEDFAAAAYLKIIETDGELTALNAAALLNKLLQFANGAAYDENGVVHEIHQEKLFALEEYIEGAGEEPVLLFYQFRHDVDRITRFFKARPHLPQPYLLNTSKPDDLDRWNRKEIPFFIAHAASAGHGLNLQDGGRRVVWFGLPWSLELYQQANARLDRQGQAQNVFVHHLVCSDTAEQRVVDGLLKKSIGQEELMQYLKVDMQKYLLMVLKR